MIAAFSGFALIGVIVLAGWITGRWAGLPEGADAVLGRLVYAVLAPCLLFTSVRKADLGVLFSEPLIVSTAAAFLCFALCAVLFRRRDRATRIVGALAGGYTNANYIGIPVATYVLGDATLVVPIVMLQLLVITPVALTLLEQAATGRASFRSAVLAAVRTPLIVAVALGAVLALTGIHLPTLLAGPITTLGQAAVPVVLISFGMSLHGRRLLEPGSDRPATVVAVAFKVAVMPSLAFLLAASLRLPPHSVYAVTVLAALPTAQNIFLYAQRHDTAVILARDAVFLSTLACVPALLVIATLFSL